MKRILLVAVVAAGVILGCGELGEEQAFPADVHGLAATVAVPGQPILVLGTGFQDDGSISAFIDGHSVPVVQVDPAFVVLNAPDTTGEHDIQLKIAAGATDEEGEPVEPGPPYELGSLLVVATLEPFTPAMQAGKGAIVGWHSYAGTLGGSLETAKGTALIANLDFGPHLAPTLPFLAELSSPYALSFRTFVDGEGGPLVASSDARPVLIDGQPSSGTLAAGPHELELRLSVASALEDIALHVLPPGTLEIPGVQ